MALHDWLLVNIGAILGGLLVILVLLAASVAALVLRIRRTERRYSLLMEGTEGGNLEAMLEAHVREVRNAVVRVGELDGMARQLERSSRGYLQRLGFVRFNPFRDAGGDQSFVLVLADQEGNGVVVSSLQGRDAARVYGKPLAAWESAYPLTEDEQGAIARARDTRNG